MTPFEKTNVLVTGATGNQGGALAERLLAKGYNVRALTRNPSDPKTRPLAAQGVTIVAGDFDQPETIEKAARDVDVAYLMGTPFEAGPDAETRQGVNAIDALVRAKVPHIIYSSVADADQRTAIPHFESKARVEEHLEDIDSAYTIVAPVFFRENLLSPYSLPALQQGKLALALPGDRALQNIAVSEVGAFLAHIVDNHEEFDGERINIASDESTPEDMARVLSKATGRNIRFERVPLDGLRKESDDFARMFEWFDKTGYSADIGGLREEFPEIDWGDFASWAMAQDWALLEEKPAGAAVRSGR